MYSGHIDISVPEIQFFPSLHPSSSISGENGANILYQVYLKANDDSYVELPEDLAVFHLDLSLIRLNSSKESYLGYRSFKVEYTGQDYLKNEIFSSLFGVSIFP